MKIDLVKLINEVSKHPEIYNPDHKDFANKEVRNYIFNTVINKEMKGIKGDNLELKWDQILNKYSNFIRKLSNDDSSERVLERFMKWPLTKPMRIFKPYVRKQFKIPVFQSAIQLLPEMDMDIMPRIPVSSGPVIPATERGPEQQGLTPATLRPAESHLTHPIPDPSLQVEPVNLWDIIERMPYSSGMHGFMGPAELLENPDRNRSSPLSSSSSSGGSADENVDYEFLREDRRTAAMFRGVQSFAKHLRANHEDYDEDEDDEIVTDEGAVVTADDAGPSSAKKRRWMEQSGSDDDGGDKGCAGADHGDNNRTGDDEDRNDDGQEDVLPDLPQPKPPSVDRRGSDFTAQEHIFLAWAKTMSTFTAQRQADIKTRINKIMSEAEFEDLDDEFFAAKRMPHRPIYTSRY